MILRWTSTRRFRRMVDVFGKGLMAYYKGDSTTYVIHRDDGYVDEVSFEPYFAKHDEWPDYEKSALDHVRGRVLDVGCGAGRHALRMQKKGFEVVAIDSSPLALEVARQRGVEECRVMDARELEFEASEFNTILLMGNNFGIAGSVEGTKNMLRSMYTIATRNGRLVATCRNPYITDNPKHLKYHDTNKTKGRPAGQITLRIEYKGEMGDWFDLLMVDPEEMSDLCYDVDWKVDALYETRDMYSVVLKKM